MYDRVGVGWDVCVLPMSCEVMEERREEAEEAGKEWGSSRRDSRRHAEPGSAVGASRDEF